MKFSREWAMPNSDTFQVKPIGNFVKRYLESSKVSVDPFARNNDWSTWSNDLNQDTKADFHLDAEQFADLLKSKKVVPDLVIFDPPYSPRQISECYKGIGRVVTSKDTQSSAMYKRVRDSLCEIMPIGCMALSFGWNSVGFGIKRGFEIVEVMMVCHGGAHNDTICIAEKRVDFQQNK